MFGGEACTRLPWNISTEPGLPVGATMPMPPGGAASAQSRVTVSASSVQSGPRGAGFLAPHLLTVGSENIIGLAAQKRDLLLGEAIRKKQVTLLVEGLDLLGCKLHGVLPGTSWRAV